MKHAALHRTVLHHSVFRYERRLGCAGRKIGWLFAWSLLSSACAGAKPPDSPSATAPEAKAGPAPDAPALKPLDSDEQIYRRLLEEYVTALSTKIGERNAANVWEFAEASDYIAAKFEALGLPLSRQGYESGDIAAQNLEVRLAGGSRGEQVIVVGAHYDSPVGSQGADDNATGVAAVLALASRLSKEPLSCSLRFVAFAQGNEQAYGTDAMGSLVYAKRAVTEGDEVVAMLSLDSLGRYTSQRQAPLAGMDPPLPPTQNFVLVAGDRASQPLTQTVAKLLSAQLSLPVHASTIDAGRVTQKSDPRASDQWAFWQAGLKAVLVTDLSASRRSAGEDVASAVDFDNLARVVRALESTLTALCALDAVTDPAEPAPTVLSPPSLEPPAELPSPEELSGREQPEPKPSGQAAEAKKPSFGANAPVTESESKP